MTVSLPPKIWIGGGILAVLNIIVIALLALHLF